MGQFTDVMTDIETTGTRPDQNGMIQLSAIKFNFNTGEVSRDVFDRCLAVPTSRTWCKKTQAEFWDKYPDILDGIKARMEDPEVVLLDFQSWLVKDEPEGGLRLWAKPISFEWPFIESYFTEYQLYNPLQYRFCRDVNTAIAMMHGTPAHVALEKEIPFVGQAHNALHDVAHQIKTVLVARKRCDLFRDLAA